MIGMRDAISAFNFVLTTFNKASKEHDNEGSGDKLKKRKDKFLKGAKFPYSYDGKITKLLANYIVEPVIIVSKDSMQEEEVIDSVLNMNTDVFTSFYVKAFDIMTKIHGMDNTTAIDILNTDNGGLTRILDNAISTGKDALLNISNEDNTLDALLDDTVDYLNDYSKDTVVSNESSDTDSRFNKMKDQLLSTTMQRDIMVSLNITNTTKSGEAVTDTVKIPITIKAHIIIASYSNIKLMLDHNGERNSLINRIEEVKSGEIGLRDLIFPLDLIKEYREDKLKDHDQLLDLIRTRAHSASSKATDIGVVGYEKNYNMLVMTSDEKVRLDNLLKTDIYKERGKQKLLNAGAAMTATFLDNYNSTVTTLTSDIRGMSVVRYKSLNRKKQDDSSQDILKNILRDKIPF